MDTGVEWLAKEKILRTIKALESNNMNGYLVEDTTALIGKIEELVDEGAIVSCGGSVSLSETGVLEHLRCGRYKFLDRYEKGLSKEDIAEIYRKAFACDAYFTSSNAVTENGELYNVDGTGNRVAAMLYGPKKVIVICGVNKIVKDVQSAIERNKCYSGPISAKGLNIQTPCAKVGYCMDCKSSDRICNEYTLIKRQKVKGRIHIIFLNNQLGY